MSTNGHELLTPAEVADLLRVKESSLAQARYRGEGPPYIKVGVRVRYPRAELDDWLRAHTHTPDDAGRR